MHKRSGLGAGVLLTVVATALWAAPRYPADSVFRDATVTDESGNVVSTDMIRSDGQGYYQDGIFCVNSAVSGNQYFLRTVKYGCTGALVPRAVTLDFSRPVSTPANCSATDAYVGGTLNICGANSVPDVRLVATSAFSAAALSGGTPVTLLFSLAPNFSGPGSFELTFEQNVAVAAGATNQERRIAASPFAIAELYQNVPSKAKSSAKVSLGRYYMPFALTVQKR